MICPSCLDPVAQFQSKSGSTPGSIYYSCPTCQESVPLLYAEECTRYRSVVCSLIGLRSHGKSVYLHSLLRELIQNPAMLKYHFQAIDEEGIKKIREAIQQLDNAGTLPAATAAVFPRPAVLRLERHGLGRNHLLMYDTSGEALERVDSLKQHQSYVGKTPSIMLLVSITDLDDSGFDLTQFLTVYEQSIRELGGFPKRQDLIVVLTKADRLVGQVDLPASAARFLSRDAPAADQLDMRILHTLSRDLGAWIADQPKCRQFAGQAQRAFRKVHYCIVSSTGCEPRGNKLDVKMMPRGVLAPLVWTIRLDRERSGWLTRVAPVFGAASRLAGRVQRRANILEYQGALQDPSVVSYCRNGGLDPERFDALGDLDRGSLETARVLLEDYLRVQTRSRSRRDFRK